jgi:hypothetical protein
MSARIRSPPVTSRAIVSSSSSRPTISPSIP